MHIAFMPTRNGGYSALPMFMSISSDELNLISRYNPNCVHIAGCNENGLSLVIRQTQPDELTGAIYDRSLNQLGIVVDADELLAQQKFVVPVLTHGFNITGFVEELSPDDIKECEADARIFSAQITDDLVFDSGQFELLRNPNFRYMDPPDDLVDGPFDEELPEGMLDEMREAVEEVIATIAKKYGYRGPLPITADELISPLFGDPAVDPGFESAFDDHDNPLHWVYDSPEDELYLGEDEKAEDDLSPAELCERTIGIIMDDFRKCSCEACQRIRIVLTIASATAAQLTKILGPELDQDISAVGFEKEKSLREVIEKQGNLDILSALSIVGNSFEEPVRVLVLKDKRQRPPRIDTLN
ncbi:MAG: hypothetical protein KatS3mg109_0130 [Pirellulaceae bacterium]|nr:MAG: hypothetical protein KatS3mg109_0130 [Pirellulaceae bacterium]